MSRAQCTMNVSCCEADPDTCTNMDTISDHESDTDDEHDEVTRLSTHLPGSTLVTHTVNNHAIHVSYLYELRCTYTLFQCLEYSNMNVIFRCMFILNLLTLLE